MIMHQEFFGNSISSYLMAIAVFLAACILITLVVRRIVVHIKNIAAKTTATIDDFFVLVLEKIVIPFLYIIALYVSIKSLSLHPYLAKGINFAVLAATVVSCARFVVMLVGYAFTEYQQKNAGDKALERSLHGVLVIVRVLVWGAAAIFFLDNLGFKISAVIAGLGIGGVAVALAAQAVLKDLFSYFSIIFDRPFKVGDFIVVDDFMGTIEQIGVKTTRVRSLGGEMLIFSNSNLTDSRLRNYQLMERRRVLFRIGVVYQTPLGSLREIPGIIETIIRSVKETTFDRAHFLSYGDFSLLFEVVYYVNSADYNRYMDIQQEVNFRIKEEFERRKIEFAYPTQTLYVASGPGPEAVRSGK